MPMMAWGSLLNSPQQTAAGTALANSTTLTDISPAPQYQLPAGFAANGSSLFFKAFGVLSTTVTPTIIVGVYWGGVAGVALAATTTVTTGSGVTNVPWRLELDTTIRTNGATGTAMSCGWFSLGTSVSSIGFFPIPAIALATVAVDTTTAKNLTVGAQWSAPSASNTITCHEFYVFSPGA